MTEWVNGENVFIKWHADKYKDNWKEQMKWHISFMMPEPWKDDSNMGAQTNQTLTETTSWHFKTYSQVTAGLASITLLGKNKFTFLKNLPDPNLQEKKNINMLNIVLLYIH